MKKLFGSFFRSSDIKKGLDWEIQVGAAALARRALLTGSADGGLSITLYNCHMRGEPWGDWEITIRRLAPASVDRSGEAIGTPESGPTEGESAVTAKPADAQTSSHESSAHGD